MCVLLQKQGLEILPIHINYGQLAEEIEWEKIVTFFKKYNLPEVMKIDINEYGKIIPSGITSKKFDIFKNAYLPGRNLLFLLIGASYAFQNDSEIISIGLLSDETAVFPDQTRKFLTIAEECLQVSYDKNFRIMVPFMEMSKLDIILLSRKYNIDLDDTYSCHSGEEPCGICISCKEKNEALKMIRGG